MARSPQRFHRLPDQSKQSCCLFVYMQAAVTADGKRQTAFMREVVTIAGGGEAPANAANVEGGEAAPSAAKK